MKKIFFQWAIVAITISTIVITGFQCSSAELTSAKLYIQRKDFQNALKQLEKEVEKNPKSEEGFFLLGQVRHELKDYKGMKEAFDRALAVAPLHKKEIQTMELSIWGKLFNEGVDAINRGNDAPEYYSKAVDAFSLAVIVLPESLITHRNLGISYLRKNEMANAEIELKKGFELAKDNMSCRLLGRLFIDSATVLRTTFNEANREIFATKKNLEGIREKMKADDVKYFIGEPSAINKPKPQKGAKKPDTKEEWQYTKYDLVLNVEDGIVKTVQCNFVYNIDSSNHYAAVALFNKAVDILKAGMALFPEDAEISENLMNSYIGAERNEEARSLLLDRTKKYPESKLDQYNLGVFLLKDSKYAEAVEQFKIALNLDPTFSAAQYNLAATFVNWGVAEQERFKAVGDTSQAYKEKFRLALPYLEKIVEDKPDDLQMWELLGQVYANLNKQEKAMEAYKKADEIRSKR